MDNLETMQLALKEATPGWRQKGARQNIVDDEGCTVATNCRGGNDHEWIDQGEANVTHILNCRPENVQVLLDIIK